MKKLTEVAGTVAAIALSAAFSIVVIGLAVKLAVMIWKSL